MTEYLYRYDTLRFWSDWSIHATLKLHLTEYPIKKRTPQGVWLNMGWGQKDKFVLLNATKKFACKTKEEALVSFKARKRRQIAILRSQLGEAEEALEIAESADVELRQS